MTFPDYEPAQHFRDFHAVITVTLGELIEGGWVDWNEESWHWDYYNEEQYKRVCEKFNNRYWDREIGIIPPLSWKRELLRKLNEIMPKYKIAYKMLDDGVDIMQIGDEYHKARTVYSDFPATQLKTENQDYASNATDNEHETVTQGDWFEKIQQLNDYNDIDVMILNDLDSMFSSFYSVNLNMI